MSDATPEAGVFAGALTHRLWQRHAATLRAAYAGAGPCHDLGHAIRVARVAEYLAEREGVDPVLPVLAALFHDCGHGAARRQGTNDHEVRSAAVATEALRDDLTPAEVAEVADAIRGRRFQHRHAPRTPVGAVLDDADNLDAIGAVGFARALLWLGEHGTGEAADGARDGAEDLAGRFSDRLGRHWRDKLCLLAAGMRTATGRRLAEPRHHRLAAALAQLDTELGR